MYGRGEYGTFSIVAHEPEAGFWGVAVATMPMAVGAIVPWAEWKTGALATQANANYSYGPAGLALLRKGVSAEEVIRRLTRADRLADQRQLGVVDRRGRAAAHTGKKCMDTATHVVGEGFTCQGNIVASESVVTSMARAYDSRRGSMAQRFLAALNAGALQGGDRRGLQSAAILIVHRLPWGEAVWSDRWMDLRVDQHRRPIAELGRLVRLDEAMTRRFLRSALARKMQRRARRA
jgi:uncharacterized Ntn-hydrolase superfamily protein